MTLVWWNVNLIFDDKKSFNVKKKICHRKILIDPIQFSDFFRMFDAIANLDAMFDMNNSMNNMRSTESLTVFVVSKLFKGQPKERHVIRFYEHLCYIDLMIISIATVLIILLQHSYYILC